MWHFLPLICWLHRPKVIIHIKHVSNKVCDWCKEMHEYTGAIHVIELCGQAPCLAQTGLLLWKSVLKIPLLIMPLIHIFLWSPSHLQSFRGGFPGGDRRRQPRIGMGESSPPLWLQSENQQTGKGCFSNALCPHLSQTDASSSLEEVSFALETLPFQF